MPTAQATDGTFDPDVVVPEPTEAVRAYVERCPVGRIQRLELDGRWAWLKRGHTPRMPAWRRTLRRWAHRRSTWLPLVEPASIRIPREARRLVALHRAGIPVPDVLAATDEWLLLSDCGANARHLIQRYDGESRRRLLAAIAGDLAQLHAAGFWHGAAQVENVAVLDDRRYRLDFEAGFHVATPVAELQGRDLFLFLMSCADYAGQCPLSALLGRYAVAGGRAAALERAAEGVRPFRKKWPEWLPGKDVRRGLTAADALLSFS